MSEALFTLALMLSSIGVGIAICRQTTAYRMGEKIIGDLQAILDKRKVTGDGNVVIEAVSRWNYEGRDYNITIKQQAKKGPSLPYPWCRDPAGCAGKGYCPRDISCGD